jgi:hypothetical protein
MFRAMAMKELWEIRGIAIAGVAAYGYLAAAAMNPRLLPPGDRNSILPPFVDDGFFGGWFVSISVLMTIALGLRQTLGESVAGTYPFLFHRPARRCWLIGMKLLVGVSVYLVGGLIAILAYGAWAATPGTHASPFEWWMTVPYWLTWFGMTLLYLGAFLSGLRPGRWCGSRLLPLAAAAFAAVGLSLATLGYGAVLWPLLLTIIAVVWMIATIFFVARERDYS